MLYLFKFGSHGTIKAAKNTEYAKSFHMREQPGDDWLVEHEDEGQNACAFLTPKGMARYLSGGLSWWHIAQIDAPLKVYILEKDSPTPSPLYSDPWQVVMPPPPLHHLKEVPFSSLSPLNIENIFEGTPPNQGDPLAPIKKIVTLVSRQTPETMEALMVSAMGSPTLSSDSPDTTNLIDITLDQSLPMGSSLDGEHICESAWRIIKEHTGLEDFLSFHKISEMTFYHPSQKRMEHWVTFHTSHESDEKADHSKDLGQSWRWLSLDQARIELSNSPHLASLHYLSH